MNLIEDLKYQYKLGSPAIKLIFINVVVFIAIGLFNLFILIINSKFEIVTPYLALSNNIRHLFHAPWTIITHEFTHTGFLHLLFNMVMLYFTGIIFMDFFKQNDIWRIYLLGGMAGGMLFILSGFLPVFKEQNASLIGASGSIMAILFATATYAPNLQLSLFGVFQVRLVWLAIGYLILDLIAIPQGNSGGHIAHIGGALFGFFFAKYRQGSIHIKLFESLYNSKPDERKFKVNVNEQASNNKHNNQTKVKKSITQEDIDIILDKISKNGYDKLSKQEKEILFKASQD